MARILLHYTCCLIVLTICVDQGDGMEKLRAEQYGRVKHDAEILKITRADADSKKKERIDDIIHEMDLLKGMAELVDHHINDFYEEFPRVKKKEHPPKTRHYTHKSFHEWLTSEHRPESTEHLPKTTEHRYKYSDKSFRGGVSPNYSDKVYAKQQKGLRGQIDAKKATTESLNKINKRNRQYLPKLYDSDYDLENTKYSKTTEMKTTTESTYKYFVNKEKYGDDEFNTHKNTRTKTASEIPNNYYENHQKYEDQNFNFHKNIRTKTASESPNKYYANKPKYDDDDFNLHKITKTTPESPNKYYENNKKYEDDDFKLIINIETDKITTDKTTPETPKKNYASNKKIEDFDFKFHKNIKTTTEFPYKYIESSNNYEDDDFNFFMNIKSTDKAISETLKKNYAIKQNRENDDFNYHKSTKTTSEFPNKYQANKQKYEDHDFNFHKITKSTEKTTSESPNKYYINSKRYDDDDFNFHRNMKRTDNATSETLKKNNANTQNRKKDDFNYHKNTKTTSEFPNEYEANKQKYADDDFNFYKITKTTEKNTPESPKRKKFEVVDLTFHKNTKTISDFPNKYQVNNKETEGDEFNFHKKAKATDKTTFKSSNKYQANNQNHEDDDFNFHENTNVIHKTTTESPNKYYTNNKKSEDDDYTFHKNIKTNVKSTPQSPDKYHAFKQKYTAQNDFDFSKNIKIAEDTITESPNKYYTNKHNYDGKPFRKSSNPEDKVDNTKYTTNTQMRTESMNEQYSIKHERDQKQKLSGIENNPENLGTYNIETRTTMGPRNEYRSKEFENSKLLKLTNFPNEMRTVQSTVSTENKVTLPLKDYYSKVDKVYRNHIQESSKNDDNVSKLTHITEIITTAETQAPQPRLHRFKALASVEPNPTVFKYKPRSSEDYLQIPLSQSTDIGSTNTASQSSTTYNFKQSPELSKNYGEPDRLQTEDKFVTKWTWPTFDHLLEEIGKKYDWRKDRWIDLKHHSNTKLTKTDFMTNFQEKHKFSYSTIKLNSTKSRRNVVIAVTAVR